MQKILNRHRLMVATGAALGVCFPQMAVVTAQLIQWGGR